MCGILVLVTFLLSSCHGRSDKVSKIADTTGTEIRAFEGHGKEVSCERLVSDLIRSSNATAFKHFGDTTVRVRMASMSPDKATIKLYVIQDVSENAAERRPTEQAIGWLEFYRTSGRLMDITNDPDRPEELRYDKNILKGHDIFILCSPVVAAAKPGTDYESRDVMLEKDIRFNGKLKRFFTLAEFEKVYGQPDSVRLLKDEAPCVTIFATEAPEDKYLYKNGSRFESSKDSVAVDEYWFLNGNFITYKGIKIDEGTTIDDIQQLFPAAVRGRLALDKEGELWVVKLKSDATYGHIKLFFKNDKVYFMHWWLPC
ncbi:hypothetical protein C5749_15030 [Sphingobacterium gobiense]|uniref:Uncharacterized protein n=2 Tax=Sphingobacterium gobiense TaxID=1382456 RepID=A0A2S9JNM9_9SPHI|nr:hypothetical protein C5749_15030 [Sphingobacterium gobiense]